MVHARVFVIGVCLIAAICILPNGSAFAGGSSRQALLQIQAQEREIARQRALIEQQQQEVAHSQQVVESYNEQDRRHREEVAAEALHLAQLTRIFDAIRSRASQIQFTRERCSNNQDGGVADATQAEGRTQWAVKCLNERATSATSNRLDKELASFYVTIINGFRRSTSLTGRYLYPTFGRIEIVPAGDNSVEIRDLPVNHLPFPVDASASCESLEGHSLIGFCEAGCFARGQMVLFSSGYEAIDQAHAHLREYATTVAPGSFLDDLQYKNTAIDAYVVSPGEQWHELVELETTHGSHLKITKNHPLILANGTMMKAEDLQLGQAILAQNGSPEIIVDVKRSNYFGKVYNLRMSSDDLNENIIVAQGVLSGSSFYQNEGIEYLNRMVMRANLPAHLLSAQ